MIELLFFILLSNISNNLLVFNSFLGFISLSIADSFFLLNILESLSMISIPSVFKKDFNLILSKFILDRLELILFLSILFLILSNFFISSLQYSSNSEKSSIG